MDPSSAPVDKRTEKIDQLMHHVNIDQLDYLDEEERVPEVLEDLRCKLEMIEQNISGYPDQLLNGLHQEIIHGDPDSEFAGDLLTLIGSGNYSVADVHEYLIFRPRLNPDTGFGTIRSILGALHHYAQLPELENYAEASAEDQAKIIALLKVTEAMEEHPLNDHSSNHPLIGVRGMTMLSGEDLIQLVLSRPSDADRISRIIIDRKILDTTFITSVLDSGAPALSSGVL
jgi:hypothetical protein